MTRISSHPTKIILDNWRETNFFVDIEGNTTDSNVAKAISELKLVTNNVQEIGAPEVPWFPTRIEDFDFIGKKTLSEGEGI